MKAEVLILRAESQAHVIAKRCASAGIRVLIIDI